MAITTADSILAAIGAGQVYHRPFQKVSTAPEVAGAWHSLWLATGYPSAGAAPAATPGTAYDDAAGSIKFPDQASLNKHLYSFRATASAACTILLYDRLVAVSGISVASVGNKTVNSTALPRYSGTASAGVEVFAEVTTVTATTAPQTNLSSYTDQDGNAAQDGAINLTWPAAATNVDTIIGPHPLASGDIGVRSVEVGFAVDVAASAGVCNVVLARRLASIYIPAANVWAGASGDSPLVGDLPRIFDGASLFFIIIATGTAAVTINGDLQVVYV